MSELLQLLLPKAKNIYWSSYLKLLARLKEIWEEQQEVLSRFEAEVVGFGEPFEESVEDYISNNEA